MMMCIFEYEIGVTLDGMSNNAFVKRVIPNCRRIDDEAGFAERLRQGLEPPFEAIEKINVSEIRRIDMGVTSSEESLLFPKKRLS